MYLAPMIARRARLAVIGLVALACTRPPGTTPAPTPATAASHLPPVPVGERAAGAHGGLPRPGRGGGRAGLELPLRHRPGPARPQLTINGPPVRVWPNGAWLAWLALPTDSAMQFRLVARTPTDSAELLYVARRAARFAPPDTPVWIDSTSLAPQGRVWLAPRRISPARPRAQPRARRCGFGWPTGRSSRSRRIRARTRSPPASARSTTTP